jgi:hypothetical protein
MDNEYEVVVLHPGTATPNCSRETVYKVSRAPNPDRKHTRGKRGKTLLEPTVSDFVPDSVTPVNVRAENRKKRRAREYRSFMKARSERGYRGKKSSQFKKVKSIAVDSCKPVVVTSTLPKEAREKLRENRVSVARRERGKGSRFSRVVLHPANKLTPNVSAKGQTVVSVDYALPRDKPVEVHMSRAEHQFARKFTNTSELSNIVSAFKRCRKLPHLTVEEFDALPSTSSQSKIVRRIRDELLKNPSAPAEVVIKKERVKPKHSVRKLVSAFFSSGKRPLLSIPAILALPCEKLDIKKRDRMISMLQSGIEPNPGPEPCVNDGATKIVGEYFRSRGKTSLICPVCAKKLINTKGKIGDHPVVAPLGYYADFPTLKIEEPAEPASESVAANKCAIQDPCSSNSDSSKDKVSTNCLKDAPVSEPREIRSRLNIVRPNVENNASSSTVRIENVVKSDPPKPDVKLPPLCGCNLSSVDILAIMSRVSGVDLKWKNISIDSMDVPYSTERRLVINRGVQEIKQSFHAVQLKATTRRHTYLTYLRWCYFASMLISIMFPLCYYFYSESYVHRMVVSCILYIGGPIKFFWMLFSHFLVRYHIMDNLILYYGGPLKFFGKFCICMFLPSIIFGTWVHFFDWVSRSWYVNYVPHMVSCVVSEYDRNTNVEAVKSTLRMRMRRLSSLPIPDSDALLFINGSELVIEQILSRDSFFWEGAACFRLPR